MLRCSNDSNVNIMPGPIVVFTSAVKTSKLVGRKCWRRGKKRSGERRDQRGAPAGQELTACVLVYSGEYGVMLANWRAGKNSVPGRLLCTCTVRYSAPPRQPPSVSCPGKTPTGLSPQHSIENTLIFSRAPDTNTAGKK